MSPEQVRGQSVDHRTDIFSFGCVLYEMLSGRSPFRRDTAPETMTAILHDEAPGLAGTVRHIPPALEGIVARCLEKSPEDRFQSARDLAHDLSATMPDTSPAKPTTITASTRRRRFVGLALAGVAVLVAAGVLVLRLKPAGPSARATGPPKIVVLPFENLGSQEDAYFAAGMTEEITSRLANVQGLGVISRTSAVGYDRRGKTIKQIGSDLGVDYVLEGSVRWDRGAGRESRVRITPQLIRVADDTHVWADRYDRVLADVFAMQSEVAENAVKAMGVALLPRERTALKAVSTNDLEAYDLYLRAQAARKRRRGQGTHRRVRCGCARRRSIATPGSRRPLRGLPGAAPVDVLALLRPERGAARHKRQGSSGTSGRTPTRPRGHRTSLSVTTIYRGLLGPYPRALSEFSTALKIQPNSSEALAATGYVLRRQGRWTDAADGVGPAHSRRIPQNAGFLYNLGETLHARTPLHGCRPRLGKGDRPEPARERELRTPGMAPGPVEGRCGKGSDGSGRGSRRVAGSRERFVQLCGGWRDASRRVSPRLPGSAWTSWTRGRERAPTPTLAILRSH